MTEQEEYDQMIDECNAQMEQDALEAQQDMQAKLAIEYARSQVSMALFGVPEYMLDETIATGEQLSKCIAEIDAHMN